MKVTVYGVGYFGAQLAPAGVDAWSGAVVRLAATTGVAVPVPTYIHDTRLPITLDSASH